MKLKITYEVPVEEVMEVDDRFKPLENFTGTETELFDLADELLDEVFNQYGKDILIEINNEIFYEY